MRFHNLQLLRVAAALGVVGYHLDVHGARLSGDAGFPFAWLLRGWWTQFPVPVFFALSGFVLTHAIQTAPPGRFLLARFLRLYPGYWLAMAVGLAVVWHATWPADQRAAARFSTTAASLTPGGPVKGFYVLGGVEWSLIYEVMLSVAVSVLSLFGVRRGLMIGVGVWLGVLAAKMVWRPGYATEPFPTWDTILLSAYSVPFLLGVFVYFLRDTGRRWRWLVFAGLVGYAWVVLPRAGGSRELHWCALGVVGAVAVWLAVQARQVSARNPLARLGDATYRLYLVHVPVMLAVYYRAILRGWDVTPAQLAVLAGGTAVGVGLAFGAAESALHKRLRPLAKLTRGDVRGWSRRAGGWAGRMVVAVRGRPAAR